MHFNAEKTEEVIFSTKRNIPLHDSLQPGNGDIARKTMHKHIGMILGSKLSFQSHIREVILKARRGITRYVSRNVLDQFSKTLCKTPS